MTKEDKDRLAAELLRLSLAIEESRTTAQKEQERAARYAERWATIEGHLRKAGDGVNAVREGKP
jgi:hypothetical protein